MKRLPGLLALASLAAGCMGARPAERASNGYEAIYRYINLADGGKIWLGEPFAADRLAQRQSDSVLALMPGAVLAPDRVRIFLTPARAVYAMDFEYVAGETYEEQVTTYTRHLGPPARRFEERDGTAVTRWENAVTRFDIRWRPGENVTSRLTDRRRGRM